MVIHPRQFRIRGALQNLQNKIFLHYDIRQILADRIRKVVEADFQSHADNVHVTVTSVPNPVFGDYQCNVAMPLAKHVKRNPRILAEHIANKLNVSDVSSSPEVAGQGFINFRLSPDYVSKRLLMCATDKERRLGVPRNPQPLKVVVDYSSPNIAKDMHVGHLRSTVLGDCLSRILEFMGHDVLRLNHVGDWGTQFGMLIEHTLDTTTPARSATSPTAKNNESNEHSLSNLADMYREARRRFDSDVSFQQRSRQRVVLLQEGDTQTRDLWKKICTASREEFKDIYNMLGVDGRLLERGESFYNGLLEGVIEQLVRTGVAVESDGALCVFTESVARTTQQQGKKKEETVAPLVIRKSDGAALYSTTDLAALWHRCGPECQADRLLYVTDLSQSEHFKAVFSASIRAALVPSGVTMEHIGFGLVLGEDGKKIKTREGDPVKLRELLVEAVARARLDLVKRLAGRSKSVQSKWSEEKIDAVSMVLGIGSVKYADLCMNREGTYKFSYDKMLSLTGNTAPYLVYAYVRVRGICRKAAGDRQAHLSPRSLTNPTCGGDDVASQSDHPGGKTSDVLQGLLLQHSAEMMLGVQLLRFGEVLEQVADKAYPHRLCDYLFELSQNFNSFYEECPVLQAESIDSRRSRLVLCALTADTLRLGLEMLGIDTVEEL